MHWCRGPSLNAVLVKKKQNEPLSSIKIKIRKIKWWLKKKKDFENIVVFCQMFV